MRTNRAFAVAAAIAVLAGCGGPSTEKPPTRTTTSTITAEALPSPSDSSPSSATATSPGSAPPAQAPGPEAGFDQVAAWVESAPEANPGKYRTATDQQGQTHDLGQGFGFVSPTKTISCLAGFVDGYQGVDCQVNFQNPLPKPPTAYGNWDGRFVSYDGSKLAIGTGRGDPGEFFYIGYGPELAYGHRLSAGSGPDTLTCRIDEVGLTCVNTSKKSGVLINDQGVKPYGCLRETSEVGNAAKAYAC